LKLSNRQFWAAFLRIEVSTNVISIYTFLDLPKSHSTRSTQTDSPNNFCVYPILSDDYGLPEKYAWLNGDGISAGSIRISKSDGYEMIQQDWHIPNKLVEGVFKYPLNICLSEYHVTVLHADRFQAVSLLNQKVAFEDVLPVSTLVHLDSPYIISLSFSPAQNSLGLLATSLPSQFGHSPPITFSTIDL
jgi:hypothetical protein